MKRIIDEKTFKFILVGIINTIFGTTIMFLCYNVFHFTYWVSSAANYVLGSVLSFFLNKYFTFQSLKRSWKEIFRFILNILICYMVAYGIAKPIAYYLLKDFSIRIRENFAMLIGMVLFVGVNYLGQRYYVFAEGGKK